MNFDCILQNILAWINLTNRIVFFFKLTFTITYATLMLMNRRHVPTGRFGSSKYFNIIRIKISLERFSLQSISLELMSFQFPNSFVDNERKRADCLLHCSWWIIIDRRIHLRLALNFITYFLVWPSIFFSLQMFFPKAWVPSRGPTGIWKKEGMRAYCKSDSRQQIQILYIQTECPLGGFDCNFWNILVCVNMFKNKFIFQKKYILARAGPWIFSFRLQ
jgi:hypothetical protein